MIYQHVDPLSDVPINGVPINGVPLSDVPASLILGFYDQPIRVVQPF